MSENNFYCTICDKNIKENKSAKCDHCIKKCTMCDISIKYHKGKYKCPTCTCRYCEKHLLEIAQYGACPGCWHSDKCDLCTSQTKSIQPWRHY